MNQSLENNFDTQNEAACQIKMCSEKPLQTSMEYVEKLGCCDVCLVVENEVFDCHKHILSANSLYFKAMFERPMKEKSQKTIDLKCVPMNSFKIILDFCYRKPLPLLIDRDNIYDVTRTADMLAFSEVFSLCKNFLWEIVNQNCFGVLMLASTLFMTNLYNYSKAYALWHFRIVVENEDFCYLTNDELQDYLSDSRLNTETELHVYKSLVKWVQYDYGQRAKHFESLFLSCIHLTLLNPDQVEVLKQSDLVMDSPNSLKAVQLWCDPQSPDESQLTQQENNNGTGTSEESNDLRYIPSALLWVGGDQSKTYDNNPCPNWSIMRWDPANKEYVKLDDMYPVSSPVEADMGYRVCTLGVEVYILGGESKLGSNKWQMQTWAYNLLERKWLLKASLLEPRRHHAVCILNDNIYVIGGFTKYRVITGSVHCYHADTDTWTVCSELIRPEFAATAASVNGKVYLFKTLDIQCYNPATNQWSIVTTDVPPAKTPGFTVMSAITVDQLIIIQSGYNNMLYQYNPSIGDQNKAWTLLGRFKDVFGSCAELEGRIYCMGNDCNHMETYDMATQIFGMETTVSCQLSRSFLVTVPFYKETMQ